MHIHTYARKRFIVLLSIFLNFYIRLRYGHRLHQVFPANACMEGHKINETHMDTHIHMYVVYH